MRGKNIIVTEGRFTGKTNKLCQQMKDMNIPFTVMDREDEIKALKERIKYLESLLELAQTEKLK